MDAACSMCGNEKRCMQGLCLGNLRKIGHLDDLDVDGKIILKIFFKKRDGECNEFMWRRSGTSVRLS